MTSCSFVTIRVKLSGISLEAGSVYLVYSRRYGYERYESYGLALLIAVLPAGISLGQDRCGCGGQDCRGWTMNCAGCGFSACTTNGVVNTDPIDLCRTPTPMTCSLSRDGNGDKIVCAQSNEVQQCYQRTIQTSGYKCSDGALGAWATTQCCK